MVVLLGLAVAGALGASDFLGGYSARRSTTGSVVVVSQSISLVVAVVAVVVIGDPLAPSRDLVLGACAGVAVLIGVASLYRGLAIGRMSVVASVSAVGTTIIPVAWGLTHGEDPGMVALLGAAVALAAVVLVARPTPDDAEREAADAGATSARRFRAELAYSLVAAAGFGVATTFYSEVGTDGGAWPALVARLVTVPVALVAVGLVMRGRLLPHRQDRWFAIGAGALEGVGNVLIVIALQRGLASVVAPVVAMYPAMTVLLARLVVGERLGRLRLLGLGLMLAGIAALAGG
ncbi:MAG TPA: DMT family transporter [Acidimicrobiia bacterium]|nr:DMT family transporter [Acidimicrobiia bacterium]